MAGIFASHFFALIKERGVMAKAPLFLLILWQFKFFNRLGDR